MTADRGAEWDLVDAAQQGDRDAYGQLYTRYAPGVSRFVGSRLRDRDLAEDLTSETFARALRRIDSVSFQGRDAGAWFTTIARNLVLDHVKSSRVQRETVTGEITDAHADQDTPEQAVIRNEAAADVRRRVGALPTDQQECIRLRFFNELSVAETAAVLGRNEGAIKALQHRGVVGLRASMTKDARSGAPPRETAPDPLDRARHAVAEAQQHRADQTQQQDRAQQLARWHTDDQVAALQSHQHDQQDLVLRAGGDPW
jgi:RNA polymerase sigma-70 factor (ECF subfamily)